MIIPLNIILLHSTLNDDDQQKEIIHLSEDGYY